MNNNDSFKSIITCCQNLIDGTIDVGKFQVCLKAAYEKGGAEALPEFSGLVELAELVDGDAYMRYAFMSSPSALRVAVRALLVRLDSEGKLGDVVDDEFRRIYLSE